jgi:hypothetical protein
MEIYLPLLVCLIGLVIYALPLDPKVNAIGKDMFWTGLLAFLLVYHGHPLAVR